MRRPGLLVCAAVLQFAVAAALSHPEWGATELYPAPADPSPATWKTWWAGVQSYRQTTRAKYGLTGKIFEVPELQWTQTAFIQPQTHPYDQYFYDVETHQYTVSRWLDFVDKLYGGVDAVLLWPTYTNIGIDDRNQWDLFRAMPGGLDAVTNITKELHDAGVRILWPYNPWDTGTHREPLPDNATFAALLKLTNGDGFNGDTMPMIPQSFYNASVAVGHPIALEPEGGGDEAEMNWGTLGWGYWSYPIAPMVDRWKLLDSRRLTNVCNRWAKNHTDDLQAAFFNGDGFETWQNVWGVYNGMTERDAEATRRVATILRYFGARGFTTSQGWEPHTPLPQGAAGIFASKWPVAQETLWTVVNRGGRDVSGGQITVNATEGMHYYDAYHGVELKPTIQAGVATLSFDVESSGFGAVVATPNATTPGAPDALGRLLSTMANLAATPLSAYSWEWHYTLQDMVSTPATTAAASAPKGMSSIPGSVFTYVNNGVEIEGADDHGVDVQYPWETSPRKEHYQTLTIPQFFIDTTPVTCSQYAEYLKSSGYVPRDSYNFLKNWDQTTSTADGSISYSPPAGYSNKPVTYVSLSEARAFCKWAGKRLPRSWEWQYAAQGTDGRQYPWGSTLNQSNFPTAQDGNTVPGPEDVDAYPGGASPFGVLDLVGNVWQYTDEFQDIHTRGVVVRGSANYRPSGSKWYFPTALELDTHNKYFLMDDAYERAGTLGLRCAQDATPAPPCTKAVCGLVNPAFAFVNLTVGEEDGQVGYETWINGKQSSPSRVVDWVHYGFGGSTSGTRRAGGNAYISELTPVNPGSQGLTTFTNNPTAFSWSDGTPNPRVEKSASGVYLQNGAGTGFSLEVVAPESGVKYALSVYVGVYGNAEAQLNATLLNSDSYTDHSVQAPQMGAQTVRYVVEFTPQSANQPLHVQWLQTSDDGNITFEAAELQVAEAIKHE